MACYKNTPGTSGLPGVTWSLVMVASTKRSWAERWLRFAWLLEAVEIAVDRVEARYGAGGQQHEQRVGGQVLQSKDPRPATITSSSSRG
jgi:hypothetical protein